ncbi:MAG: thioredoxin [Candidatus Moranbacteria bacterium]|nr:thioredoxin [Candidatus Moranbacteria bacterium]
MSMEFNSENFKKEVVEASKEKPVLVDFFAEWCGPCKMQGPIVDELAKEIGDKAIIGKLNIESTEDVAGEYGVMSIPTMLVFKDGEVKETMTGLREKGALEEILKKYL